MWLSPLLAQESFEVRMTVPQGFDAYVRIFFPFVGADIVKDNRAVDQEHITWTEMAHRSGRIAHALMEQETILEGPNGEDEYRTSYGSMAPEQFDALFPILARHTASSGGWFLLWDGWGALNERAFNHSGPKVEHSTRNFYLLRGQLASYDDFPHEPNFWWPDDRAWCVCTDVDFDWAYLAGSAACVAEVLAVPIIDAYATKPENPAHSGMDVINDPDGLVPRA